MPRTDIIGQPGISPAGNSPGESWGEWLDRHSSTFFIAPAVSLILIFAIFPTFYSIVFALSRVRFTRPAVPFVWFHSNNFSATTRPLAIDT
jgi:multiple sugar transport system permease protein